MLKNKIYQTVRQILFNKYAYPIEQIQPEIRFQVELAVDSLEMFELMNEFEQVFGIIIDKDDIDNFIYQSQDIKYISDVKLITIQDVVNYIEKQIQARENEA